MSLLNPQGMKAYRAPSLLQPHRARQALKDAHTGKITPLVGFWHAVSSPPIIRITAQLGFDVLCIDWEHSSCNIETMTQASLLWYISPQGLTNFFRWSTTLSISAKDKPWLLSGTPTMLEKMKSSLTDSVQSTRPPTRLNRLRPRRRR